jgi:peptidoglycan/xylan/chitin deacetylase (PgdA/CDA1 family)
VADNRRKARSSEVPKAPAGYHYWAAQRAHRLQVALARRARGLEKWQGGIRILGYHRVAQARDELAVAPGAFRDQMQTMLAMGAEPVSLADARRVLREGGAGRYVCVTFDDGYHDNLANAVPVLRELGIPATIFVPTAVIDGGARLYWYTKQPRLLSWSELGELCRDRLITIGAHTRTHPALPKVSDELAWSEIAGSKAELEDRLGREVSTFAYPAGMFGEREAEMVRRAGFEVGVTTQPGLNRFGVRPETLHRSLVDRQDDIGVFVGKLTGLLDAPWTIRRTKARQAGAR